MGQALHPEETDLGYGLTYAGKKESTQTNSLYPLATASDEELGWAQVTSKFTFPWKLDLMKGDDIDTPHFKGSADITVDVTFDVSLVFKLTLYQSDNGKYGKVDMSYKVGASGTLEGSVSGTIYFKRFHPTSSKVIKNLFDVDIGVGVRIELSGKVGFSLSVSQTISVYVGNYDGSVAQAGPPVLEAEYVKPEVALTLTFIFESKATKGKKTLFDASANAGVKFTVKFPPRHICDFCADGNASIIANVTVKYPEKKKGSIGIFDWESQAKITPLNVTIPLFDFYYSTYCGFGLGRCPYRTDDETPSTDPTQVKSIAMGNTHSAAITVDGALYTWGWNIYGQLGNGIAEDSDCSVPVKIMDNVKAVSLGSWNGAAIKEDGSLYAWGHNDVGQVGNGTTEDSTVPVWIMDNVRAVSLGGGHSAAITADGGLYTWGSNVYGQLGNGTTEDSTVPVWIMDNVKAVSLGGGHSAAITADGGLYTWGSNVYGQLGNGTTENSSVPVKIMDKVKAVSLGGEYSAAITEDGSLYTWGRNDLGQLGNGTTENSYEPVWIMDNVKAVSLGIWNGAAITEDSSLHTWGGGYFGEVTEYNSTVPIWIMDNVELVSFSYCAGNDEHNGVIKEDGSLYTWGTNQFGELGNGTTEKSLVPIQITLPAPVAVKSLPPTLPPLTSASAPGTPQEVTLTDLTPGAVYNLYCLADRNAAEPLGADNLLYINQYTADESGSLSVTFTPTRDAADAETFVMLLPEPENGLSDDINADETVDIMDVIALNKYLLGSSTLDDAAKQRADVDSSGEVDSTDSLNILKYVVELITALPIA